MKKTVGILLLLCAGLACLGAQSAADPLVSGLDAYARSDWSSAILAFRKAVSDPATATGEAWYWLIMSELSAEDYAVSLRDMDRFLASFPGEPRVPDITYQKGRVLFLQEEYEKSIQTLYAFVTGNPSHPMAPSAYYWIGECLFAVGRYEEARSLFYRVVRDYPLAVKREAAQYRISLIEQTDREEELLKLLKVSHEESLRVIEDYQRRQRTYEQAVTAYQKRISDMIKDTRLGELEKQLGDEKVKNAQLMDRVAALEIRNAELAAALAKEGVGLPSDELSALSDDQADPAKRRAALERLREKARALQAMYDAILAGEGSR